MAPIRRANNGRARWLVVFTLLLFVAGAVPVLADSPGAEETSEVAVLAESNAPLPNGADLAKATQKVELKEEEREQELESPAAIAEREESQHAYKDLESTGAISGLLRSSFSEELASLELDPARYLTDSTVGSIKRRSGVKLAFKVGKAPMFYRVDATFRNQSGEKLAHHADYFRVMPRKVDVHLILANDSYKQEKCSSCGLKTLGPSASPMDTNLYWMCGMVPLGRLVRRLFHCGRRSD